MRDIVKHTVPITFLTIAIHFASPVRAQAPTAPVPPSSPEVKAAAEEQVINLDDIKEEASGPAKNDGVPDEPLLPVAANSVEVVRTPLLRLTALALVLPVAAMLFRVRRRRGNLSTVSEGDSEERKET